MDWQEPAARLAGEITDTGSRWRPAVAAVPRHLFVPAWWEHDPRGGWTRRDGRDDEQAWLAAACTDRTLVTRIGTLHADHAAPGDRPAGRPTSSSTAPGLAVAMYRHARIPDGADVLDIGTGSGYGCALLARRLGDRRVTSIDIDPYLAAAARERLAAAGLHPHVTAGDAAGPLPGTYDRIVSMMSVPAVPASWLAALRDRGVLATTIAGTGLLLTAEKTPDGGAAGRTEWYRAGFMQARTGPDYPSPLLDRYPAARHGNGDDVKTSPYPVCDIGSSWELKSMLGVTAPGTDCHYEEQRDGTRTAWLLHPDGSWARASAPGDGPAAVAQAGPRRLWDLADAIRRDWLRDGRLPAYGAAAAISPDGTVTLRKGTWSAVLPAAPAPQHRAARR